MSDYGMCEMCNEEMPRKSLTVWNTLKNTPYMDDILLCPKCAEKYRYEYRASRQPKTQQVLF